MALAAALAADEKKGSDIALLHPGRAHPLADYLLVVTASSRPHMESLERFIIETLKNRKLSGFRRGRPTSDSWRILDFGGLLVHLMTPQSRAFYALEKLYGEAPRIRWEENRNGRPH